MLSSPPNGALCTKYRALIAEMQKRKRPVLCYSQFRAKALVKQTITAMTSQSYSLSDECLHTRLRVTENQSFPFLNFCYIYIYIYIAEMQKRKRPILCYSEFRAKALVRQTITESHSELH